MRSLRLLQVVNSEACAERIARLLQRAGFEVASRIVQGAESLRHALEESTWDLVIARDSIPDFDARDVLHLLREWGEDVPCMVVSDMRDGETAVEMMRSGACDFFSEAELARLPPAVERELVHAAAQRKNRQFFQELWQQAEQLALAADATQLGTFDYHPQTGRLIWSEHARQHFGLASDKMVTYDTFLRALHPCDRKRAAQAFQDALCYENGGEYAHEYRAVGIDDRQMRWLSSRGRVFFDQDSRPVRFLGVVQDISDRKRRDQRLPPAARPGRKTLPIDSFTLEIMDLSNIVQARTRLILAGLAPKDSRREPMEEISQATLLATGLTRQLLLRAPRGGDVSKAIHANEFIKAQEDKLRELMGLHVELELILHPESGAFEADPGQVEQVLMCLARNSKEAMPAGGRLRIETSRIAVDEQFARIHPGTRPGPYVMLSVADTGMGLTPKAKSHLFEPHTATQETTKSPDVGLSAVYAIVVHQCHGAILVSSQPGRGTTIKLLYPALEISSFEGSPVAGDHSHAPGITHPPGTDEEEIQNPAAQIADNPD